MKEPTTVHAKLRCTQLDQKASALFRCFDIKRAFSILLLSWITLLIGACTPDHLHDSDARLIEIFHDQRPIFNQLLTMVQADQGLERVDYYWTHPDPPPISSERLALYRKLLTNIGCVRGFENFKNKNEIIFIASAAGLATGGSSKGYYYSATPPSPLVEDLDAHQPDHTRSYTAFRRLKGHWYLIYEYDD